MEELHRARHYRRGRCSQSMVILVFANCHKDECFYSQTVGFLCLGQYWKEKPEYILYTNAYDSVSTAKTRTCNASESLTVAIRIRCRPYTSVNGRQTRSNRATCYMFIPERFFNTYRTRNAHVLMEPRLKDSMHFPKFRSSGKATYQSNLAEFYWVFLRPITVCRLASSFLTLH